jgi:hypothetical protein
MMLTSQQAWNTGLSGTNYDQAWSMVHFLAHADGGNYQKAFDAFVRDVSYGKPWEQAWVRHLGSEVHAFEDRWREYWERLPDDPTAELYDQAIFATFNSYYARAFAQRQFFRSAEAFFDAAAARELKAHRDDWLPSSLLRTGLRQAEALGTWSIEKRGPRNVLICVTPSGTEFVGQFKVRNKRAQDVHVKVNRKRK